MKNVSFILWKETYGLSRQPSIQPRPTRSARCCVFCDHQRQRVQLAPVSAVRAGRQFRSAESACAIRVSWLRPLFPSVCTCRPFGKGNHYRAPVLVLPAPLTSSSVADLAHLGTLRCTHVHPNTYVHARAHTPAHSGTRQGTGTLLVQGRPMGHLQLDLVRGFLGPHPHLGAAALSAPTGEN